MTSCDSAHPSASRRGSLVEYWTCQNVGQLRCTNLTNPTIPIPDESLVTHEVWAWTSFASNFLPVRRRTNHVEIYRSRYRYNLKDIMIDTWSRICLWWRFLKKSSPIHPFDSTLGKTHCRAKRTCTIVTWKETGRRWVRILVKAYAQKTAMCHMVPQTQNTGWWTKLLHQF